MACFIQWTDPIVASTSVEVMMPRIRKIVKQLGLGTPTEWKHHVVVLKAKTNTRALDDLLHELLSIAIAPFRPPWVIYMMDRGLLLRMNVLESQWKTILSVLLDTPCRVEPMVHKLHEANLVDRLINGMRIMPDFVEYACTPSDNTCAQHGEPRYMFSKASQPWSNLQIKRFDPVDALLLATGVLFDLEKKIGSFFVDVRVFDSNNDALCKAKVAMYKKQRMSMESVSAIRKHVLSQLGDLSSWIPQIPVPKQLVDYIRPNTGSACSLSVVEISDIPNVSDVLIWNMDTQQTSLVCVRMGDQYKLCATSPISTFISNFESQLSMVAFMNGKFPSFASSFPAKKS